MTAKEFWPIWLQELPVDAGRHVSQATMFEFAEAYHAAAQQPVLAANKIEQLTLIRKLARWDGPDAAPNRMHEIWEQLGLFIDIAKFEAQHTEGAAAQQQNTGWQVWADEGSFHGEHGHPYSRSICVDNDGSDHQCIALVFGKTDEEAKNRAQEIVRGAAASSPLPAPTPQLGTCIGGWDDHEGLHEQRTLCVHWRPEVKKQ
jgi:hypothetical protein